MLKPPVLSFTDTGLSVSDGVTRTGLWSITSDIQIGWEYSLDLGKSWIIGQGQSFEVTSDGPQTIWVRSRDNDGNVSESVVVSCVLDTKSPTPLQLTAVEASGITRFDLQGREAMSIWEYSLDQGASWWRGSGSSLSVVGNVLTKVWLRQTDLAGNASAPTEFNLSSSDSGWRELSTSPARPDNLGSVTHTLLAHGEVDRSDADYFRVNIPAGAKLTSAKFTFYQSPDEIAFYAMQRAEVFDAGTDVNKMLTYGHFGPKDIGRNLVESIPDASLRLSPLTTWVNQTGTLKTKYVLQMDVTLDSDSGNGTSTDQVVTSVMGSATNSYRSEVVSGLGKLDKFTYNTAVDSVSITNSAGVVTVRSKMSAEVDQLSGVERVKFSDKTIAFDLDGNAGQAYRIYKAAFGRNPIEGDMAGLGYWVSRIDNGMDVVEVAARFIDSNEFGSLYGKNPSNADFLSKVYSNVLGRLPDQGGFSWWLDQLNTNPEKSRRKVLADFSESLENKQAVASLVGNGIPYIEFAA